MKLFFWSFAIFFVMAGCASSSKKSEDPASRKNLVSLKKPGDQPNQPSKVYIDSVTQIEKDQTQVLLIDGTFPDACTHLKKITHQIKNGSLYLELKAWRNPETMCAQVLTPFSIIYGKISEEDLSSHTNVIINGTAYNY